MIQRCTNPNDTNFKNYGGRGVRVCDRWRDFVSFIGDMGSRPTARHSIERINNDGNYAPENCRWATQAEQAHNTRSTRLTDELATIIRCRHANGEIQKHIAKDLGVHKTTISLVVRGKTWR